MPALKQQTEAPEPAVRDTVAKPAKPRARRTKVEQRADKMEQILDAAEYRWWAPSTMCFRFDFPGRSADGACR